VKGEEIVGWLSGFVSGAVVELASGTGVPVASLSGVVDQVEDLLSRHGATIAEAPAAALWGVVRGLLLEDPEELRARVETLSAEQIAALVAADAAAFGRLVDGGLARADAWRDFGLDALAVGSRLGQIALAQGLAALVGLAASGR